MPYLSLALSGKALGPVVKAFKPIVKASGPIGCGYDTIIRDI